MSLTRGFLTENLYDSPFAGFQYFLYGMRLILKRVNNFGKSYSNQFGLFYRWNHIFIMQQKDWDCGIACCAMVLKWYDLHPNLIYRHELSARGRPLWSIDLFIFLCQTGLNAIMYTTSLDVQQHHSDYDWYQTSLEEDSKLIKNQIEYTVKKQLNVINVSLLSFAFRYNSLSDRQKCLTIQEIASILCDEVNVIAIILIDALTFSGKPSR